MPTPQRLAKIERMEKLRQPGLTVVLEDIHDPHNAAAILRSCDAFGVRDVYFVFEQEKYYNPRQVGKSSSSSANLWLNFHICRSTTEAITALHEKQYQLLATVLDGEAQNIFQADLTTPQLAILVGNEKRGLSPATIAAADKKIYIPMRGMVQSLNVSVTTGMVLFEVTRQRNV